ncbi:MAG: transglycosylase SLT domain-containing protein, partial [Rhodothermales bacterium]|nr:transglycosylase SLT domain-containing protein [Rhodothermales bacterium]
MPLSPRLLLVIALFGVPVLALGLAGCDPDDVALPDPIEHDLADISERDTLVALTAYNSTSYFVYRGEPMGYEYDLLREFAEENDLVLRMKVVNDRDSLFYYLNQGVGDLVAARVVPSAADTANVAFTEPLYKADPVVVQRNAPLDLPEAVDSTIAEGEDEFESRLALGQAVGEAEDLPETVELEVKLVTAPSELAGETVHVPGSSGYVDRLVELQDHVTGDIEVVEVGGDVSAEKLIRRVATGAIDLTVTQEELARLKKGYFTNIVAAPDLGEPLEVTWATRTNAPELLAALNAFITDDGHQNLFGNLYRKYYVDRKGYRERFESEYLTSETGRLSAFDELFKAGAEELGWDWRLLASQAFQESRFKPRARSWAGAAGLLQLMPPTARQFGVTDVYDPEDNVGGAVRFLQWLTDYWEDKIPDPDERRKFILASYNTGHGHVEDARRLTAKYDGDDTRWEEVAF